MSELVPNVVISVSALPKTGKNYFAYTSPDPIRVYCFNGGAAYVAKKYFPKKKIDIIDYHMPIVEDTEMRWAAPLWDKFRQDYQADIDKGEYITYVFDTATEIENICQQTVLEEEQERASERNKNKQKLATNDYLSRNLRMKALFDLAKDSGVNLISLQYLKEEWIRQEGRERAEPTGNYVIDGWKRTESQADINLELRLVKKGAEFITRATVISCRFDRKMFGKTFDDTNFDEIQALLVGE